MAAHCIGGGMLTAIMNFTNFFSLLSTEAVTSLCLCTLNATTKCSYQVLQRQIKVRPGVAGAVGQYLCVCAGAGGGRR